MPDDRDLLFKNGWTIERNLGWSYSKGNYSVFYVKEEQQWFVLHTKHNRIIASNSKSEIARLFVDSLIKKEKGEQIA